MRDGNLPTAGPRSGEGEVLLSWRVYLLPFLNEESLVSEFHLDEPWDSPS